MTVLIYNFIIIYFVLQPCIYVLFSLPGVQLFELCWILKYACLALLMKK